MDNMSKPMDLGELKVGSYIIIDGEPCKIVNYTKSKPGKHGAAKARIVAIGVFDESKRTIVKPVSAQVDVPLIEKKTGQVIALLPSAVQLMDLETYEMTEAPYPEDEELKSKMASGVEVEYWQILGRTRITRTKG
ncbi:MAG: translation initiation factor IF-5A [Candidatus Bathyarchaeota archaeon]|nr:translation initiation factor IF-5A [Candidatus Bathyarchaeota archaeon]